MYKLEKSLKLYPSQISKFMVKSRINKDINLESCVLIYGIKLSKFHMIKKSSKLINSNSFLIRKMYKIKPSTLVSLLELILMVSLLSSVTTSRELFLKINLKSPKLILRLKILEKALKFLFSKSKKGI